MTTVSRKNGPAETKCPYWIEFWDWEESEGIDESTNEDAGTSTCKIYSFRSTACHAVSGGKRVPLHRMWHSMGRRYYSVP